jgi:hypothetical protein
MDVAVYVHAKTECPERSDWAATLLTDVRKHIVDKGVKCKLILSTDNSDRYQLHLEALQTAAKGSTVLPYSKTIQFSFKIWVSFFTGSLNDDIWYLTPSQTAYFIRGEAAVRLMKHVDNPSVSTKTHRDIIVDHSSAMYMNVKLKKRLSRR